ncbi:MAG: glycoside hydrolase family 127 protein [Clostridia bacterium]|nr:glycoside hydrolase family 127 protein [Clostridia bacterium]
MQKYKNEFVISSFDKDKFLYNLVSESKFGGVFAKMLKFTEENQIKDVSLWKKFAHQFKFNSDDRDNGWRCEYWGKMMRGAASVCAYTQDEELYKILEDSVRDLLTAQDENGRISSYSPEVEFHGWDIWGRKYVMLGLQYFYEICDDERLKADIISSMCRHLDYIIAKIGKDKLKITETSTFWLCANSCSILEPVVRLYKFTGKKEYMDFADYIVDVCHGSENELTIFKLALENELLPHEYPEQKAYETMSCFEGLAEYYRLTGIEKYKTAVVNFAEKVRNNEISIIGCSGCTHEIFDNTRLSQVDPAFNDIMQETCVSVTWMKFCGQVLRLTGDPVYADCIENTFYNAFLGAVNTHKIDVKVSSEGKSYSGFLPFDSYSALRAFEKGVLTGGMKVMSDGSFYGCCACISPMAFGTLAFHTVLRSSDGIILNFYHDGVVSAETPSGKNVKFNMKTEYPYGNSVKIAVNCEEEQFVLALRIPQWSKITKISLNFEDISVKNGYTSIEKVWKTGDLIEIEFDSRVFRINPPEDSPYKNSYVALRKGALILAADRRMGIDPDAFVSVKFNGDGTVDGVCVSNDCIPDAELTVAVPTTDGSEMKLIDYSSAGKTFSKESTYAAWLKIQ